MKKEPESAVAGDETTRASSIQAREAHDRLAFLVKNGLNQDCLAAFERGDVLMTVRTGLSSAENAIAKPNFAFKELIANLEKKYGFVVYHATGEVTSAGRLIDLFHVSKDVEEWEDEREGLSRGLSYIYCVNCTFPHFSQFGTISFEHSNGGIVRVI